MRAQEDKIEKVSQVLVGHPFLQPLGHEREALSLNPGDLRTGDDYFEPKRLSNRDAAGAFIHDDAGVVLSFLRIDEVTEVVRRHFTVGVKDTNQQLLLPTTPRPGQIRPDRVTVVAQAVARLTTLLEERLAPLVISTQIDRG